MKFNELAENKEAIERLGGVVSLADFANLLGLSDTQEINYALRKYIDNKILKRFINGYYITDNFKPELLCQKIYPQSYLSLGTILANNLVIGSIPRKTIYAVKLGRGKEFDNGELKIKYFSIAKELFFGWQVKNGINYASSEKAFIDLLYYYQKGFKPSFNIYTDLNLSLLKRATIQDNLRQYNNKKFKAFVKGVLEEYEY